MGDIVGTSGQLSGRYEECNVYDVACVLIGSGFLLCNVSSERE